MKRNLMIAAISCQLLALGTASANAQEGLGIQGYGSLEIPSTFEFTWLGLGFGGRIGTHWVVSAAGYFSNPPVVHDYEGGGAVNTDLRHVPPFEYGVFIAYRFCELNPSMYVFVGYSRFPQGGMSIPIDFVHAGVGLAPFRGDAEVYPELSVVAPLHSRLIVPEGGNLFIDVPARVPVMVRLTIKLFVIP